MNRTEAQTKKSPISTHVAADLPEIPVPTGLYPHLKYATDRVAALMLLVLTLPVMLLAMLLVKLTSRGPIIYQQTRLGLGGKPFTIYKIRTMTRDAERNGACWSLPGDSRVTWIGRWLRATHLDELPQLWNILRGDMSLVGPRPERPEFVPHLEQAISGYRERLRVRPGLTGLAQVQLPPDTDLNSVRKKLAYDVYYVSQATWWLDARICWATALGMMGVSFSWLRILFRFPAFSKVRKHYARYCLPKLQPVTLTGVMGMEDSGEILVPVLPSEPEVAPAG